MFRRRTTIWGAVIVLSLLLTLESCTLTRAHTLEVGCDANELIDFINIANSDAEPDTILLAPGCMYLLNAVEYEDEDGPNGLPPISTPITFRGESPENPSRIQRLHSAPDFRIFNVTGTGVLTLENVELSDGSIPVGAGNGIYGGGGILNLGRVHLTSARILECSAGGAGGAIHNRGTLEIDISTVESNHAFAGGGVYNGINGVIVITGGSTLSQNTAEADGGAIRNDGVLTLEASNIIGNIALFHGGGIRNEQNATATLFDVAIQGNKAEGASGGGGGYGGGIDNNAGTMTLTRSSLTNNWALVDGGGIRNLGIFAINESVIEGGIADRGGGIFNEATLTIQNSSIASNEATDGGGISNNEDGDATIIASTIKWNSATQVGGILNQGQLTLVNVTVSGNYAESFGGISYSGPTYISFSTIANNSGLRTQGNGIRILGTQGQIKNSIVANNEPTNCETTQTYITPVGENLSNDSSCSLFTLIDDPLLLPLANNGGGTETHALPSTSPAVDAAADCMDIGGNTISTDQTGKTRPSPFGGSQCDLGAFESVGQSMAAGTAILPPSPTPPPTQAYYHSGTATTNANCRAGPSTDYNETGFLAQGFTAQIEGRNEESTWLWIQTPNGEGHCWVSMIAVEIDFDPAPLPVIAAQPLPPTKTPTKTSTPEPQCCTVKMPSSGILQCVCPCPTDAKPGNPCDP